MIPCLEYLVLREINQSRFNTKIPEDSPFLKTIDIKNRFCDIYIYYNIYP